MHTQIMTADTTPQNIKPDLPPDIRLHHFSELPSTNLKAFELLDRSGCTPFWVMAEKQTAGRGRQGRAWHSLEGNLFTSLALKVSCPIETAMQLSFVAANALYDSISDHLMIYPRPKLELKWPNDLLVNGAKMAGILIESSEVSKGQLSSSSREHSLSSPAQFNMVIGFGINITSAPKISGRETIALHELGNQSHLNQIFSDLVKANCKWLDIWNEGEGFHHIRTGWLKRAFNEGTQLFIQQGKRNLSGTFQGLDEKGGLLLEDKAGVIRTITTGELTLI